ncbi:MAG: SMI1/KNR4 family protein [Oscillospiraceae bacterium]|nr:SMI1/KNR4 family protein [Oscillospiraceae bacterium]
MDNWGEFEFNEAYSGSEITKINDVVLPEQYIEFMKKHNGGEGDIGESWLILYRLEELQEVNDEYKVQEYLAGCVVIGTNGGDEFYGIDKNGNYFNVPSLMCEEDITLLGDDLNGLPEKINDMWSD